METSHNTTTSLKNRTLTRIAMVILGIATAVIGTLSDVQLLKNDAGANEMISTTKVAMADFSIQLANTVTTTLWPF